MVSKGSFTICMDQVRAGDSRAEMSLYDRYVQRLIALAASRMQNDVSSKLDPDDVVQSVFRSFFQRNSGGNFYYQNWDSLWSLLARITVRKCSRKVAELKTARRNVHREYRQSNEFEWELVSREPTPEQVVALTDLVQHLFDGLRPNQRSVLALKLQQFTNEEISEKIGRTERTVYRTLSSVRKHLETLELQHA